MYSIYFDTGKPLDGKKAPSGISSALYLNRVCAFEPQGGDVYAAQILLSIQFIDVAVKVVDIYSEVKRGHIHIQDGETSDMLRILQSIISIPFLLLSSILFFRFKHAFSRQTQGNIVKICYLMFTENILNFVLRFVVALKTMVDTLSNDKSRVVYLLVPLLFGIIWTVIFFISSSKKGDYNAPPGMLYMQQ